VCCGRLEGPFLRPQNCDDIREVAAALRSEKRIFSLAIKSGRIAMKPHIPMLREAPARAGFFEPEQYKSVLAHLPTEICPYRRPIWRFRPTSIPPKTHPGVSTRSER
jgi:hypothetical protein